MKAPSAKAAKFLGNTIGVLLYACVLAIGGYAAVGIVTWLAYATETTFLDTAAVLAVTLYGMSAADRVLGMAMRWVLKRALRWCLTRLRAMLGGQVIVQDDQETIDRAPVWLERPPCEGTYLVQHPDGAVEHGVRVKRYLPRMGLFAILLSGLTPVDEMADQGYRFDGPLSSS